MQARFVGCFSHATRKTGQASVRGNSAAGTGQGQGFAGPDAQVHVVSRCQPAEHRRRMQCKSDGGWSVCSMCWCLDGSSQADNCSPQGRPSKCIVISVPHCTQLEATEWPSKDGWRYLSRERLMIRKGEDCMKCLNDSSTYNLRGLQKLAPTRILKQKGSHPELWELTTVWQPLQLYNFPGCCIFWSIPKHLFQKISKAFGQLLLNLAEWLACSLFRRMWSR